jgi:hypothetical protein
MKEQGSREVDAVLRRVKRLNALGRVGETDCRYIVERLQEVEARIVIMSEIDERGDPL